MGTKKSLCNGNKILRYNLQNRKLTPPPPNNLGQITSKKCPTGEKVSYFSVEDLSEAFTELPKTPSTLLHMMVNNATSSIQQVVPYFYYVIMHFLNNSHTPPYNPKQKAPSPFVFLCSPKTAKQTQLAPNVKYNYGSDSMLLKKYDKYYYKELLQQNTFLWPVCAKFTLKVYYYWLLYRSLVVSSSSSSSNHYY